MSNASIQKHQHNASARATAQAAVESLAVKPTSRVEYRCSGRVAVIGGMEAIEFAPRLPSSLQAQIILLQGTEEPGVPVIPVGGRTVSIQGYLGAYTITLGQHGKANYQQVDADLILDLSPIPLLSMPLTPPGYIHAASDEDNLLAAADQLTDLIGTFEKPRYFDYDASICAHGRAGQVACNRCIEACPAEAITALAESIEVNPYLCQGGGVCATVCPSGAIQYAYPRAEDLLEQIRILLRVYRENDGKDPIIAFFSEADGDITTSIADNVIPILVEELGSVGLEVWLSALAYGASAVLLVDGGAMQAGVSAEVEQQRITATEILASMGYPLSSIRIVRPESLNADLERTMTAIKPAAFSAMGSKRQTAFMAIDHLYAEAAQPKPLANLSVGAAFGMASVDEQRCTLCLSCAGICPGHALQTGDDVPQLQFIESNCLQCGLCTSTCPENAIWITPRLQFDREARNKARVLYEELPFCCVSCGKPFATQSMIRKMTGKLDGHWMFQDERAKRRLMMCDDCRVADIMQDQAAMAQGFETPPRRQ
jgi:ferredoxin